jgi:small subunit ribosomal protein S15
MITTEEKSKVMAAQARHKTDTGSPEVQIGILTARITELTEHMKQNPKDNHSRRGLLQMVGLRKKLLAYLKSTDINSYQKITTELKIRTNS